MHLTIQIIVYFFVKMLPEIYMIDGLKNVTSNSIILCDKSKAT